MVKYARVSKDDIILEIGAGYGALTCKIADRAGKVYAIEEDGKICGTLRHNCEGWDNIEVIEGNALKLDFPTFDKVVSNLPYSISSKITFKLLEHDFDLGILMYQYEFAKKMVAEAGSKHYTRLSVVVQSCSNVRILELTPEDAFIPKSKVKSAIVEIFPRKRVEEPFLSFVKTIFSHRRKKMKNVIILSHILGEDTDLDCLPSELMEKRPGELTIEEIEYVADQLKGRCPKMHQS